MPTQTPRTVNAVQNTINLINRYDELHAKAESTGDIGKMTSYEARLLHLDALVANISDKLWDKYVAMEGAF